MSRLLFWIAFVILVVMAVRAKLREAGGTRAQPRRAPDPTPAPAAATTAESERMACCAHCGLYFPASEAVRADGRDYCCPAHVRQPPQ